MKAEKVVPTLVLVVVFILIIQTLLAMLILMINGDPNSKIGSIASILIFAPVIVLSAYLNKLFELFTGRNFGEIYYRTKKSDDNEVRYLK